MFGTLGAIGGGTKQAAIPNTIKARRGIFSLSGQDATLTAPRRLVAGTGTFTLTGQAATLTNSSTPAQPGTPTIVWTSDTATTPPVFSFTVPSDADLVVGDVVRFERSTASDFSVSPTDYTNTVDSSEDLANALTFSSGSWADGTWYVRARTERSGAPNSDWSNTETKTLATVTVTTMDPAHASALSLLSGGNLVVTGDTAATLFDNVRSTASHSTGKYYCEFGITNSVSGEHHGHGLVNAAFAIGSFYNGQTNDGVGAFTGGAGQFVLINAAPVAAISAVPTGGTVGMAVDLDAHLVWFTTDGSTWTSSGAPASGTGGVDISVLGSGPFYATVDIAHVGNVTTVNFGATGYVYAAPSGFGNW